MLTLGFETSCDETSVSVTDGLQVLSNIVTSSIHLHKKYGGVVPEIASRYHVEYIAEVLDKALSESKKTLDDIKLVAVTNGPGLVGALLIGLSMAKSISYAKHIPIIGVNHIIAHLHSAFLNEDEKPGFPFVGLVVSGGHTALFYCKDPCKRKLLGQTQDDAVGEAYDKVAKILGLGYPGGPIIDKMARQAKNTRKIVFPKSYLDKSSFDFSFSGIKTAVLYYAQKSGKLDEDHIADICYAFQESVLDVLVQKTYMAADKEKTKTIVVGGGVAANSRLREKMSDPIASIRSNPDFASRFDASWANGVKVYFPKLSYCMDNAAMIGTLGEISYKNGVRSDLYLSAEPNLRLS